MSNFYLKEVDFFEEIDQVWEIFRDSLHMFSDMTLQCAGHTEITNKYALYDLFRWTLVVPRCNCHIGVYNFQDRLIGLIYLTHITPIEPVPDENDYDSLLEWEKDIKWEGCYHGSLHPAYRTPKFSANVLKKTINYFIEKSDIDVLFSFLRADNRQANLILRRNGFELIELMEGYRKHGGVDTDYNLYVYRGG